MKATALYEQARKVEFAEFLEIANKACALMGGWKHETHEDEEGVTTDCDYICVAASSSWSCTTDFDIHSIEKAEDGHIVINAVDTDCCEEVKLCANDIEYGHLQWLSEEILFGISEYYIKQLAELLKNRENNELHARKYTSVSFMFQYGTNVKMEILADKVQLVGDDIIIYPIENVLNQQITIHDVVIDKRIELLEHCIELAKNESKK